MKNENNPEVFNFAKYKISNWHKLWMWILPTYEQKVGSITLRYKKNRGTTYVLNVKRNNRFIN